MVMNDPTRTSIVHAEPPLVAATTGVGAGSAVLDADDGFRPTSELTEFDDPLTISPDENC